ncbi:hypothetical protein Pen01_07520 [Phytomonospora endophytica]|nr:hypothetical protein Pen01_07520 [Phytomonospora endophytica]
MAAVSSGGAAETGAGTATTSAADSAASASAGMRLLMPPSLLRPGARDMTSRAALTRPVSAPGSHLQG